MLHAAPAPASPVAHVGQMSFVAAERRSHRSWAYLVALAACCLEGSQDHCSQYRNNRKSRRTKRGAVARYSQSLTGLRIRNPYRGLEGGRCSADMLVAVEDRACFGLCLVSGERRGPWQVHSAERCRVEQENLDVSSSGLPAWSRFLQAVRSPPPGSHPFVDHNQALAVVHGAQGSPVVGMFAVVLGTVPSTQVLHHIPLPAVASALVVALVRLALLRQAQAQVFALRYLCCSSDPSTAVHPSYLFSVEHQGMSETVQSYHSPDQPDHQGQGRLSAAFDSKWDLRVPPCLAVLGDHPY